MFLLQHFLHKIYDIFLTKSFNLQLFGYKLCVIKFHLIMKIVVWVSFWLYKLSLSLQNHTHLKRSLLLPIHLNVWLPRTSPQVWWLPRKVWRNQVNSLLLFLVYYKDVFQEQSYERDHRQGQTKWWGIFIPCRHSVSTTPNCVLPSRSPWNFTK